MKLVILDSAYKHNVSEKSITSCLLNVRNEVILTAEPEKRLFVGFGHNAVPLEIIGIVEDDTLYIIHAMKLRPQNLHFLEETREV
jgi:hypothetical protein